MKEEWALTYLVRGEFYGAVREEREELPGEAYRIARQFEEDGARSVMIVAPNGSTYATAEFYQAMSTSGV